MTDVRALTEKVVEAKEIPFAPDRQILLLRGAVLAT